MLYTIEVERNETMVEIDLDVELRYHKEFKGGRDEPSEDAWYEITEVLDDEGYSIMDNLSAAELRDIFWEAQSIIDRREL